MSERSHETTSSNGEFVHPLARNDHNLIQEFMLTKIILLASRNVSETEWAFELEAMDAQLGSERRPIHVFLFFYTVARYSVAIAHSQASELQQSSISTNADARFLDAFLGAVDAADSALALALWHSAGLGTESSVFAPAISRLTFELMRVPSTVSSQGMAAKFAEHLPDPYAA